MPANNCRRDCQERFRVEGEDPRRRWPTAKAQGPAFTLSPLARPGKAVALEARIELWSASDHLVAFQFLKTILRDDERFQQSRYAGHNIVSTETGLAATGVFTSRRAVGVEVFLLTSPFIERLRRANRAVKDRCALPLECRDSAGRPAGHFPGRTRTSGCFLERCASLSSRHFAR
jgi:hypothetical protein